MLTMVQSENNIFPGTCGIVLCGGKSQRMGQDKSMLQYHKKPQRYHLYDLLKPMCEQVIISCNATQAETIEAGYEFMEDQAAFDNIGPMAALLSAFTRYPSLNMLLIGCDYPFLTHTELCNFSKHCIDQPTGFYNTEAGLFEPMLAWYPATSCVALSIMHQANNHSLQFYLREERATKYLPIDNRTMISIDSPEDLKKSLAKIKF